jgi:ribosomal-protein-alanine N-acetyltransferase
LEWLGRSATPSDLGALEALVAAAVDPGWSRAELSRALAQPMARVWVAESEPGPAGDDDRLIGFVVARRILDILEVDLVGVRSDQRQRGVAKRLLGDLLEAEVERGLAEARLELAATNDPARRLYTALGFVVVGKRSRYYPNGDDALLLSRTHFERRSGPPA